MFQTEVGWFFKHFLSDVDPDTLKPDLDTDPDPVFKMNPGYRSGSRYRSPALMNKTWKKYS
jgi:hypothetical protein